MIIAAAAAAVLIGAYFVVSAVVKRNEENNTHETDAEYTLPQLDSESLTALKIRRRTESEGSAAVTELSFTVKADMSGFTWDENPSVPLNPAKFADIADAVSSGRSATRMEGVSDADLASYGLADPEITATFTFTGGRSRICSIGNYNSFNGRYYFCSSDEPGVVYMADGLLRDSLNVDIFDLLQYDSLPEISAASVKSLTYTEGDRTLVYTYFPSGNPDDYTTSYNWYLSVNGGTPFAVDKSVGEDIAAAVAGRELLSAVAYDRSRDRELGFDAPGKLVIEYSAEEKVDDSASSGTGSTITRDASYTLYFGGSDENAYRYVRTPGSDLVYTVSHSDTFSVVTDPDDNTVRPAEIISPEITRIDSIVFSDGTNSLDVRLTHVDGTTTYKNGSGEDIRFDKYSALMDALTSLTATSFTSVLEPDPSSSGEVLFSASFGFNSGKEKQSVLEIRSYSQSYCRAVFMGRGTQLITADEAQNLRSLLADYFA